MGWREKENDLPKVKHIVAPRIQHHVTYMEIALMGEEWLYVFVDVLTKGPPKATGY